MAGNLGSKHKLTPQDCVFIEAYTRLGDANAAARIAQPGREHDNNAGWKFLRRHCVKEELKRIRETMAKVSAVNVESLTEKTEKAIEFAFQTRNANALVKAIELQAKLHGLIIDKHDIRAMGSFQINITGIDTPALPTEIIKPALPQTTMTENIKPALTTMNVVIGPEDENEPAPNEPVPNEVDPFS